MMKALRIQVVLILGCLGVIPAFPAQKSTLYRSDQRADVVQAWVKDVFSAEPLGLTELPVLVPNDRGLTWYTAQDLENNIYLRQHPDDAVLVAATVARAEKSRQDYLHEAQSALLLSNPSLWSSLRKRPMAYINAPKKLENPNDTVEAVALRMDALSLRGSVIRLVDNRLFASDTGSYIPESMRNFIDGEFDRLKTGLSPANAKRIKNCSVSYENTKDQPMRLWLGSEERTDLSKDDCPYKIRITPLLVRAIFVSALGDSVAPFYDLRSKPYGERNRLADFLLSRFSRELHFVLAHEMCHLFLGRMTGLTVKDEELVDWGARRLTLKLDGKLELGAFSTILVAAVKEGHSELWSLEAGANAQQILDRLALIPNYGDSPPDDGDTVLIL